MKYIISESKFNSTIINYFDKLFQVDEIKSTNPYDILDDETGEEGFDENRIEFYLPDNQDKDVLFRVYFSDYFHSGSDLRGLCPLLIIEHPYDIRLIDVFGDMWREPFKIWFKDNFNIKIKTIRDRT